LRERHFNNKSLNNEPLLKLMILEYAPYNLRDQVKNRFFPGEILNFHLSSCYDFAIAISRFLSGSYTSCDIDKIEYPDENYISQGTIEFLRNHNLGLKIHGRFHLDRLLKRIDRLGLLFQRDIPMKDIIKFELTDNSWKWSAYEYEKYLRWLRDEHDKYLSIIESFK
jgi:hypothetical protein